jgi:hypothetical protein
MARGLGETTLSSSASGGGKYEEVYLRAYTIGPGARASMDCYLGLPQQLMATFIAEWETSEPGLLQPSDAQSRGNVNEKKFLIIRAQSLYKQIKVPFFISNQTLKIAGF